MYALDAERRFVCDILPGEAFLMTPGASYWTTDPVPQPCHSPKYLGGEVNPISRRVSGGEWVDPLAPTPEDLAARTPDLERESFKLQRQAAVANIRVTTAAGNVFQGDEVSQGRMARAILGLQQAEEGAGITWVLADNQVISASLPELTEALQLAGLAQAALWVQEIETTA